MAIGRMDQELQNKCLKLIKQYCLSDEEDTEIRNEIFMLMKDWMIIWVKSILSRWGKYEEEGDILGMAWDAFYFSIGHYKVDNPIPSHFYNYTRYFLLMEYAKEEKVHLPLEELKDTLSTVHNPQNSSFEDLLTYWQFRDVIPDKYKVVWDDATQSLSSKISDRKRTSKHGMDETVYRQIKASYIPIIKLILGYN